MTGCQIHSLQSRVISLWLLWHQLWSTDHCLNRQSCWHSVPTLDVLFLLFSDCIFHQLKRKLSYKILSIRESEKSPPFAFRACFCMSVITPSCQFLADFAACKANFSAGADKPGLENQLYYCYWIGEHMLLLKGPFPHLENCETSRTVRKIKCFNTWKYLKQWLCLVFTSHS